MKIDLMVDIECYATNATAAIVQIGALLFERSTFQEVGTFLVSVPGAYYTNPKPGIAHKFCVDPKTMRWWSEQCEDAQQGLRINPVPTIRDAVEEFSGWLMDSKFNRSKGEVWSKPPQFDMAILHHAFETVGEPSPWHNRQERCLRTAISIAKHRNTMRFPEENSGLVKHRADHDCMAQVRQLQGALGQ